MNQESYDTVVGIDLGINDTGIGIDLGIMNQESYDTAIGIDLGTCFSRVAVWLPDGKLEIIPNDLGDRLTPCYVSFGETEYSIGDLGKDAAAINPRNTIFDFKKLMGRKFSDSVVQRDWPFKVVRKSDDDDKAMIEVTYQGQRRRLSPEWISAIMLTKMKNIAEEHLGHHVTNAVISVPPYFDESQRQATRDAGKVSGLHVLDVIDEPVAAALVHDLSIGEKNVLIFDIGGCSSVVSVIENEVMTFSTNECLGGQAFDDRMLEYLIEVFDKKHGKNIRANHRGLSRLLLACERAKRALSFASFTTLRVDSLHEGIDFEFEVTRSKFEELNSDLFKDCLALVDRCLEAANMTKKMIGDVVLVGGSSRIPKLKQLVQDFFDGKKLCRGRQPEEAVAHGVAVHAANLNKAFKAKKALKDYINETRANLLAKKPSSSSLETEIGSVMEEIGDARRWLQEHEHDDANVFTNKRKRLQTIWSPIIQKQEE